MIPTAAATRYTPNPAATPPSDTNPARRPCDTVRETRYIMFGPGVSTNPNATTATPNTAAISITQSIVTHRCRRVSVHFEVAGPVIGGGL
ncbi:hypothetical protein NN4_71830 [Nocardia ninae NBRC 108245]|uniref:Uncharacterized protein n=1 Tax=Nocardia ninae NBRC 108245 TaxID=1210091 RepID=A0A511MQ02_9NOCA|nr:hypothetical protein NN4_71830 [Nocardia ninae NBRC 108245]